MNKSENKISELEKEAQQASKKTSEFRNKAELAKDTAQTHLKRIIELITIANSELSKVLEVKEESVSINNDLINKSTLAQESYAQLVKSKESVDNLITQLETIFENHPELKEELNSLEEDISKSEEIITKINSLYKNSLTKKQEIDQLHIDINGYNEEDEETGEEHHIEGLKDKLENSYATLIKDLSDSKKDIEELNISSFSNYNSLKTDWEAKYIILEKKIESLLPNALTAGLSSAYSTKKNSRRNRIKEIIYKVFLGNFRIDFSFHYPIYNQLHIIFGWCWIRRVSFSIT